METTNLNGITPEQFVAEIAEKTAVETGADPQHLGHDSRLDYELRLIENAFSALGLIDTVRDPWTSRVPDADEAVPSAAAVRSATEALDLHDGDTVVVGILVISAIPFILRYGVDVSFAIAAPGQYGDPELDAGFRDAALSALLSSEIPGSSGRFIGVFDPRGGLPDAIVPGETKLLDVVIGASDGKGEEYRGTGPVLDYQEGINGDYSYAYLECGKELFALSGESDAGTSAVLVWPSPRGGRVRNDFDMYRGGGFYDERLKAVVQLPDEENAWLFTWSGSPTSAIVMSDLGAAGNSATGHGEQRATSRMVEVSRADVYVNGYDYTPSHYVGGYQGAESVRLGSMASRISRGTSLSRKNLELIPDPPTNFTGGLWKGQYCGYVDTSSIRDDPHDPDTLIFSRGIAPEMIATIPEGQSRYVVDTGETVLLVPRNGKRLAVYRAPGPTLVSNNLFAVWLEDEWRNSEYLSRVLTCGFVSGQIYRTPKPITKKALENLIVPVPPEEVQEAFVASERARDKIIARREEELEELKLADGFEYMYRVSAADEGGDER